MPHRANTSQPAPPGTVLLPRPPMPSASLRVRVHTSPLLRSAAPRDAMLARAQARADRLWEARGETRAQALRAMRAVVAGTPLEGEVDEIARRHIYETLAWGVLFWRRWPRHDPIEQRSRARLEDAFSQGRGVVLSACHYGPQFITATMLATAGIAPCVVSMPWFFEDPGPGLWGRRLAHWRREVPDLPRLRARGSYPHLRNLLSGGHSALLYFDMPGKHETSFLGKPAGLVDGSARLAVEADALVLPLRTRREGRHIRLDVEPALDPRTHTGPGDLHAEMATIHERLILDDPAAMHDPASYGWGEAAGPLRWGRAPDPAPHATT